MINIYKINSDRSFSLFPPLQSLQNGIKIKLNNNSNNKIKKKKTLSNIQTINLLIRTKNEASPKKSTFPLHALFDI